MLHLLPSYYNMSADSFINSQRDLGESIFESHFFGREKQEFYFQLACKLASLSIYLEVVDGFQWVNAGNASELESQDDGFIVLRGVSHVLPDEHEIRPEGPTLSSPNIRHFLSHFSSIDYHKYRTTFVPFRKTAIETTAPVSGDDEAVMDSSLNSACSTLTSQSPWILLPRKYLDLYTFNITFLIWLNIPMFYHKIPISILVIDDQ